MLVLVVFYTLNQVSVQQATIAGFKTEQACAVAANKLQSLSINNLKIGMALACLNQEGAQ
jgi:hypothetical protein